jgi:transposase-like protein
MVMVKDLTEVTLKDLWQEVKGEEDWWQDLKQETLRVLKRLLESAMEEELMEQLRAGKYRHTELRRGYRNGYRHRSMLTALGLVERLKVPRDRNGSYQPILLERYQRRQQEVNRLVRESFLAGVSTRRVGEVLAPVLGEKLSPQTVSRIAAKLDNEVWDYHHRLLPDNYIYLLLDGISMKVKVPAGVKKRLVLCAYGITPTGKREIISFRQASAESEAQWEAFLRELYNRGLEGKSLRLIATDGCAGLHRALDTVYPYTPRQRCWAHKLRNMAAKMRRSNQAACLREAKGIYQANTMREAVARFHAMSSRWLTD